MIGYREILFFVVILLTNIIQCITGFAGTVLAMPFSLMLVGYGVAKPVLNVLGIVASVGVVGTNYKSINIKELLKIVAIMLIGMLGGIFLNGNLSLNEQVLYKILGAVVLFFVALGCYTTFAKGKTKNNKTDKNSSNLFKNILGYVILISAGLVHGMFVCGGPLLIIYASEHLKDRDEFRATLSSVWIVLNSIIMFSDIKSGYFNSKLFVIIAISVVILFLALFVGNYIAKKMNYKVFMIITYILMAISGLSLLVK